MPGRALLNTVEKQLAVPIPSGFNGDFRFRRRPKRSKGEFDMKSTLIKTLHAIAIGIGILLVASPLCAQADHQFTMQVPFAFSAGNQLFLAGDYTIKSDISTGTVVIRREDGPAFSIGTYSAGENKDYARAKLVFNQ